MDLLSTEILFEIFSYLTPREGYALGQMCREYYLIYVEKFIRLKPNEYIFYRASNPRDVEIYEFLKIKSTLKSHRVIFDKKYSTCEECILFRNVTCKNEANHKSVIKYLKFDREGELSCKHPIIEKGRVFAIKKTRIIDLYKSICQRCGNLKLCKSCSVIDGNCGITRCSRNALPVNFNLWSFKGMNYTHYHNLCRGCFNNISKNITVNLFVNNTFPE